ncbi:MAG: M67 family metallopeptidase [Bacteroidetes bacterium]|nr:M67 family metallopeptidase [Bacteroidota bacterium]
MKISIKEDIINKIFAHAKKEAPIEACGYISGKILADNEGFQVEEIYYMTNIDNREDHYSFDPQEQFDVLRKVQNKGLRIIGNYHSHPASPARPSKEDISLAYDPDSVYIIASLLENSLKAFRIINGNVTELLITK